MKNNICKFFVNLVLVLLSPAIVFATPIDVPNGSTVKISSYTASTDFTLSGGTLEFDVTSGQTLEYEGIITGTGTIEKTGDGKLTFNGGRALTSDTTLVATGGRFRFKDFAEAGAAKLSGNGGYFGNVSGYSITIPSTTVVRAKSANLLNFYVEGVGTNVVLESCSGLSQRVIVSGDSFASVMKFAGRVEKDAVAAYLYITGGTTLLANPASGIYINWIDGYGGRFMFGTPTSKVYSSLSFYSGCVDVGGLDAQVKILKSKSTCPQPESFILTNSAPVDASLTVTGSDTEDLAVRYVARDGDDAKLTLCYDYNGSSANYDLGDALFDNSALAVEGGQVRSSLRSTAFNTHDRFTTPGAAGRYLRLIVTRNLDNNAGNGMLRIGEFRLTRAGHPVSWPTGTTATSPNPSIDESGIVHTPGLMIDGNMETYWQPNQFTSSSRPATNIIDMTREVAFNGYQIATGGDRRDFSPRFWTLDVGRMVNGEIVWERVSDVRSGWMPAATAGIPSDWGFYNVIYYSLRNYYCNYIEPLSPASGTHTYQGPQIRNVDFNLSLKAPGSLTLTGHLESVGAFSGTGTLNLDNSVLLADSAADFTGTINVGANGRFGGDSTLNGTLCVGDAQAVSVAATDAVGDDVRLNLGATGRLALTHASERVGGLSGTGTVDLGGDGVLTLGDDCLSTFSGAFVNGGTVVLSAGTFSGSATADGDYVVRGAGGAWKGTLAVSGKLTLEGNLRFSAEDLQPGRHVLATFGSLGAGSTDAIAAAVIDPAPAKPLFARVVMEGNSLVMYIAKKGLYIFFE